MNNAARRPITSAFGFSVFTLDMVPDRSALCPAYSAASFVWRELSPTEMAS
jgi:hypothetical protein